MNGRIYDPLLGRFLSADLLVQAPGNLQSYNRYSYVQNNPLTFTDPTGHFIPIVIAGVVYLTAAETAVVTTGVVVAGVSATPAGREAAGNFSRSLVGAISSLFRRGYESTLNNAAVSPPKAGDMGRLSDTQKNDTTVATTDNKPMTTGHPVETPAHENESITVTSEKVEAEGVSISDPALTTTTTGSPAPAVDVPLSNDMKRGADHGNSAANPNPSGTYTNTHESGKTYTGVGSPERAQASAERIAKQHNDPVVSTTYKPATNRAEAYKQEDKDIQANGGAANTDRNYNKINSPGRKLNAKGEPENP